RRLQRRVDCQDARGVGADSDERHLTEAEDPGVAGEDLQRDDEDHVDEEVLDLDLGRLARPLPAPESDEREQAGHERRAEERFREPVPCDGFHDVRAAERPSSPCGRSRSRPMSRSRTNAFANWAVEPGNLASNNTSAKPSTKPPS